MFGASFRDLAFCSCLAAAKDVVSSISLQLNIHSVETVQSLMCAFTVTSIETIQQAHQLLVPRHDSSLQDPNIKNMAEQIAQDPAFAQMSAALQASMVNGGAEPGRSGSVPPIDPDQYANAMSSVLQNPQFMEMAEKLGQQIMTVRSSELQPSGCFLKSSWAFVWYYLIFHF